MLLRLFLSILVVTQYASHTFPVCIMCVKGWQANADTATLLSIFLTYKTWQAPSAYFSQQLSCRVFVFISAWLSGFSLETCLHHLRKDLQEVLGLYSLGIKDMRVSKGRT